PAPFTIRGMVPVGRTHHARYRQDDRCGAGSDARRKEGLATKTRRQTPTGPFRAFVVSWRLSLAKREGRIEPYAKYGTGWQLDVFSFRRGNRAAAADQDAGQSAFESSENAADDGPDARARADLSGLSADPLTLERLRHRGAQRMAASANGDLIK